MTTQSFDLKYSRGLPAALAAAWATLVPGAELQRIASGRHGWTLRPRHLVRVGVAQALDSAVEPPLYPRPQGFRHGTGFFTLQGRWGGGDVTSFGLQSSESLLGGGGTGHTGRGELGGAAGKSRLEGAVSQWRRRPPPPHPPHPRAPSPQGHRPVQPPVAACVATRPHPSPNLQAVGARWGRCRPPPQILREQRRDTAAAPGETPTPKWGWGGAHTSPLGELQRGRGARRPVGRGRRLVRSPHIR